jgi:hypothetical protein
MITALQTLNKELNYGKETRSLALPSTSVGSV